MRICPECNTETDAEVCAKDGRLTVEADRLKVRRKDPNVGLVIEDKYEIVSRIGRGGMGAVYKAVHKETGGDVAIKVMRSDMVEDESAIRRFYIEAQNTHKLHHPNTVRVSDFGQTREGVLFLVMEFVNGRSLLQVLKQEGQLAPSRAVHISEQILKSLGEAHEQGIIHRDVKPDNVMLIDQFGEPDFVKVLDFGISRSLEGSGASTKGAIGTPKYMAPEQWRGERLDARADLYACGGILYRMLTGRQAFSVEGKGSQQVVGYMTAHLNEVPGPMNVDIPADLERLTMDLLAKALEDRPRDARETLQQLRAIAKHCTLSEEPAAQQGQPKARPSTDFNDEPTYTPTSLVGDKGSNSPPSGPIINASATGVPGVTHHALPKGRRGFTLALALGGVMLALGALSMLVGGDEAAEPERASPTTAVNAESAALGSVVREEKVGQVGRVEEASRRLLTLQTIPQEALVHSVEGEALGSGTLTLSRGAQATTLTTLADATERRISEVVVSLQGYRSERVALVFPVTPGAEETLRVELKPVIALQVEADRKGTRVRLAGTEEILGKTPFKWLPSQDAISRVEAGDEVNLEFITPAAPVLLRVNAEHLSGQRALKARVSARFKAEKKRDKKSLRAKKKAKPTKKAKTRAKAKKKKSGWGW